MFGNLTLLPGFTTDSYQSFLIPVSLMQGAGFTGAATGVNLARDIEQGWFDRLLASPAPRSVLLDRARALGELPGAAPGHAAARRSASRSARTGQGSSGLAIALVITMGMAIVAAAWGTTLALRVQEPVGGAADAGGDAGP